MGWGGKGKGGRLANDFSWSFSRHSTFTECQKKYWYTYYGSWEGWPKTPYDSRPSIDPLASHLYMLKQIKHLPMFLGTCVHETIEHALKARQHSPKKEPLILEELLQFAEKRFQKGLEDSRTEAWKASPKKHANLFEHYFAATPGSDPITAQVQTESIKKITECLTNWAASPIVKMAFDTRARWVSIEELTDFKVADRFKIMVVIDFAMKWQGQNGNESIILFDWKTGGETEKTEEQLYSYALYAHRVLGVPLDRIILSPFYLGINKYTKIGYQQEVTLEEARLQKVEQHIASSCEIMSSRLPTLTPAADAPQPDPSLFPYTENRGGCPRCPFKELCTKASYQDLSREELTTLIQSPLPVKGPQEFLFQF